METGWSKPHIKLSRFFGDYFFLFLLLTGIGVNYYFEMRMNRSIKRFTSAHQQIMSQRAHAEQVFILENAVMDMENKVRRIITGGDTTGLSGWDDEEKALNRQIVVITEQLRTVGTTDELVSLRLMLQQKIRLEREILDTWSRQGKTDALAMTVSEDALGLRNNLNSLARRIHGEAQADINQREKKLEAERLALISLDYAMPHLTSFVFLVIAGFILYKILQSSRLNRNLTEAIEKEQKAQEAKDKFMDNMTHELRSPMNSVLGYTNLLLRSPLNSDQEKFVRSIKTSGEHLLHVINEVLDLSKIKSGYVRFSSEPFSLREQMDALSDIVRDKVLEKKIRFECKVDADVPDLIRGDSSKFLQILLNLTSNALKFTNEGMVTVTTKCKERENDHVSLLIEVADTGIGIPADKLPKIFERFYQVDPGPGKSHGGTGLGLSITREMLVLQGGDIRVESEPGKGTTFFVDISFDTVSDASEVNSEEKDGTVRNKLPVSMKVLVVDDNSMNRELVAFMLRDMGVKYSLVASGMEALTALSREEFHAVLMDLQMPGMDGKEATRRIREELRSEVPVVALSAYAQTQEKQKCLEAGMDAYLSKPVREHELFETLEMFAPGPEAARVDIQYLRDIAQGNTEFVESVILRVADTLPRDIENLKHAVYENDHEKVNMLAHDMKTTFAVLGISDVVAKPIRFLESWKSSPSSMIKAGKMLESLESIGAQVTFQILDSFGSTGIETEPSKAS